MDARLSRTLGRAAACAAALLLVRAAAGDPASVVNALRTKGCTPKAAPALARDKTLDAAARELARSGRLQSAVEKSGYRAQSSTMFHIKGARDDKSIRAMLQKNYCADIGDAKYEDVGVFQTGDETWIVVAKRMTPPPNPNPATSAGRVLELVNAARAAPRKCGRDAFEPAAPLALSPTLSAAAAAHARDMAQHAKLDHRGSDGSGSAERITRAGYVWRASGENVAAGQRDADSVVAAWLASPGHCSNIMAPFFTEMGLAFALAPDQNPAIYWAQEFAAPR
jgi:uncharacterized protein YkwD